MDRADLATDLVAHLDAGNRSETAHDLQLRSPDLPLDPSGRDDRRRRAACLGCGQLLRGVVFPAEYAAEHGGKNHGHQDEARNHG